MDIVVDTSRVATYTTKVLEFSFKAILVNSL